MGNGCHSIIIAEADWILLMPILYIFGCFELYKACLMVKYRRIQNLLDVLTQYETLEFCRLGLNREGILPNRNLGYFPENQISAGRRFIEISKKSETSRYIMNI